MLRLEPSLAIGYNQSSRRGLKEPPGLEVLEGETPTTWEEKGMGTRIPPALPKDRGFSPQRSHSTPAVTPHGLAEGPMEGIYLYPPLPVGGWGVPGQPTGQSVLRPPIQKRPRPALIRGADECWGGIQVPWLRSSRYPGQLQ